MRPVKQLIACGLGVGVCAGVIASVAIPQTRSPGLPQAAVAAPVPPAAVGVRRTARARETPREGGFVHLRAAGPVRVAVTVPDPRGGPPWAVRQFRADRLAPDDPGGTGAGHVIGRNRCVQLGRLHAGRFGWLTSDGTFRPIGLSLSGAPTQCLSRRPDLGGRPWGESITTMTDPRRPAAEPVQTVVFGLAGAAARDPRLTVAGQPAALERGAAGTLLAVLPADTMRSDLRLTVRYPGRGTIPIIPARRVDSPLPRRFAHRAGRPAPGAKALLAAQAPDPDGGLPHGLDAKKASGGGFCVGQGGRVVGDRVGHVDYALDILRGDGGGFMSHCPANRGRPGARLPDGRPLPPFSLSTSWGGGIGAEPGEDPRAGRIARRSLPGRVVFSGTAEPNVRYLTFATPSDVRTIAPSGPAHAFLIVYAGGFPTGPTIVTTTFDDGRTRRDELPNFGI